MAGIGPQRVRLTARVFDEPGALGASSGDRIGAQAFRVGPGFFKDRGHAGLRIFEQSPGLDMGLLARLVRLELRLGPGFRDTLRDLDPNPLE